MKRLHGRYRMQEFYKNIHGIISMWIVRQINSLISLIINNIVDNAWIKNRKQAIYNYS